MKMARATSALIRRAAIRNDSIALSLPQLIAINYFERAIGSFVITLVIIVEKKRPRFLASLADLE